MNKSRLFMSLIVTIISMLVVGLALAADSTKKPQPPATEGASTGIAPTDGINAGINSLANSYVEFDPSVGGDTCYIPDLPQTFCFKAESYTDDWEYVYNLWEKFPSDWTVTNVYVEGTPSCTGGGSWGTFSWSFETDPNEVNIAHSRYQSPSDNCIAYYCFEVVAGSGLIDVMESWYWDGDGYGAPPHNPCSSDNYTPPSMSGQPCDDTINPQASIPPCAVEPGVYILPEEMETSGCNGIPQTHSLNLYNYTGENGLFNMTYTAPEGMATLTGPDQIYANNEEMVQFEVTLTPNICNFFPIESTVETEGNGYSSSSVILKDISTDPSWEVIEDSEPSWGGLGYPRDGCTAQNSDGDWVTYLMGDTSTIVGFWGYNLQTNTWFQPAAADIPADRWAPDWAYDPATNLCYLTGGANTPGGGNYNEAYVYDPVANSFSALSSFTSIRDFHNSWVGTIDGIKYLCIGGGVNASSILVQSTQCFDLNQELPGVWNAENDQIAAYPTDPFGAADGVLHATTGDQFWYVGGAINNSANVTDEARYWDDADNSWHFAGNTGVPRYRVEGDFYNDDFYQLGGSSGGFTYTNDFVRGHFDGSIWVWSILEPMHNYRMDNIVAVALNSVWSIDGYGNSNVNYVERSLFCPTCYPPEIEVNAPPLESTQPPDTQSTIPIQICNTGEADLSWVILEYQSVFGGSMPFTPVTVEPISDVANNLTVSSNTTEIGIPVNSSNPEAILWDQPLSSVDQYAYVDQVFPDVPEYSSFLADDFTNVESWVITSIFIPGDGWNGFSSLLNATSLTWQIYADDAGIPAGDPSGGGAPPLWTLTLLPQDPQVAITTGTPSGFLSDTQLNLSTPIIVPPGTYWLVFYPTMEYAVGGQYGRQPADTTNGAVGKFINPGNGFGLGTEWQDWSVLGATMQDIAFRLEGEIYTGIPWLSETPYTGITGGGSCSSVDVNFDSTGLSFGLYSGDMEIVNNDPEEPEVGLSVTLNVEFYQTYLPILQKH